MAVPCSRTPTYVDAEAKRDLKREKDFDLVRINKGGIGNEREGMEEGRGEEGMFKPPVFRASAAYGSR